MKKPFEIDSRESLQEFRTGGERIPSRSLVERTTLYESVEFCEETNTTPRTMLTHVLEPVCYNGLATQRSSKGIHNRNVEMRSSQVIWKSSYQTTQR